MGIENDSSTPQQQTVAADDARRDFERVSQAMHDGGAREAYKILKEESQKTKNLSPEERNAWQKEMTAQLTQSREGQDPILGRLSLAYIEDNFNKFKSLAYSMHRMISADKLEKQRQANNQSLMVEQNAPDRDVVNDVEAALLAGLSQSPNEHVGRSVEKGKDLGMILVDVVLDRDEKDTRRAAGLEDTERKEAEVAGLLLENNGELFDQIDSQFGENHKDGRISQVDLRAVLAMIEGDPRRKESLTPEQLGAIYGLKSVFTDSNNLGFLGLSERQGSILNHDRWGQFLSPLFRQGVFEFDTYYVTRGSLARETAPNRS